MAKVLEFKRPVSSLDDRNVQPFVEPTMQTPQAGKKLSFTVLLNTFSEVVKVAAYSLQIFYLGWMLTHLHK